MGINKNALVDVLDMAIRDNIEYAKKDLIKRINCDLINAGIDTWSICNGSKLEISFSVDGKDYLLTYDVDWTEGK